MPFHADGNAYAASDDELAMLVLKPLDQVRPSVEAAMREREWKAMRKASSVRMANTSTGGGQGGLSVRIPSPPPLSSPLASPRASPPPASPRHRSRFVTS